MRYLTDPTWLAVIVGGLTLILALVQYLSTRNKKSLSYDVISEYPLVSVDDEIRGKLIILYEGNSVENVHMVLVRFINDGSIPIAADDYERPLTLIFPDDTDILSAEYVSANPSSLVTSTEVFGKKVTIKPVLMNNGDFFTIKILAGKYGGTFQVDARIIGVKGIKKIRKQVVTKRWWLASGLTALVALAITIPAATNLITTWISPPPAIKSVEVGSSQIKVGETVPIVAIVSSPSADKLIYEWQVSGGRLEMTDHGNSLIYKPDQPGVYTLQLRVADRLGRTDVKTREIVVTPSNQP